MPEVDETKDSVPLAKYLEVKSKLKEMEENKKKLGEDNKISFEFEGDLMEMEGKEFSEKMNIFASGLKASIRAEMQAEFDEKLQRADKTRTESELFAKYAIFNDADKFLATGARNEVAKQRQENPDKKLTDILSEVNKDFEIKYKISSGSVGQKTTQLPPTGNGDAGHLNNPNPVKLDERSDRFNAVDKICQEFKDNTQE